MNSDFLDIVVTQGNINNGHFYIPRDSSIFPQDSWGGGNKDDLGICFNFSFHGIDKSIDTDIDGKKRIVRFARGLLRQFYIANDINSGDFIRIKKLNDFSFKVFPLKDNNAQTAQTAQTAQKIDFNRNEIENEALSNLTLVEQEKYIGFWTVSKKLNRHVGSVFDVDHVISIKNGKSSAITHSNLQILIKGINASKNRSSWTRMSYDEQCEHIISNVKFIPNIDIDYIGLILKELEIYWD